MPLYLSRGLHWLRLVGFHVCVASYGLMVLPLFKVSVAGFSQSAGFAERACFDPGHVKVTGGVWKNMAKAVVLVMVG